MNVTQKCRIFSNELTVAKKTLVFDKVYFFDIVLLGILKYKLIN